MSGFFWQGGHIGWGIFAVAVFTCLWWLAGDLYWRLRSTRAARMLAGLGVGWLVGAGLIVLGFLLGSR